jgi:ribosome-binding protein aMBF1 (putative translation factor)
MCTDIKKAFGAKIRNERGKLGITQEVLAEREEEKGQSNVS